MTRTLQSELNDKGLVSKLPNKRNPIKPKNNQKQKTSKLSRRDLEELMGTRRPTYKRNRGAFRQK